MNHVQQFYIGIDGGGTRCRARIIDQSETILGEAIAGSANVFQDAKQAWKSVHSAITQAAEQAGLSANDLQQTAVVAGLAGSEVTSCANEFLKQVTGFKSFELLNDAQIACLGAHSGQQGAIYIIGTGSIGIAYEQGDWRRIGGWGFPLDDIGSGAWLGQQAVRIALKQKDGQLPVSPIGQSVWQYFNHETEALTRWSQQATSGDYGQFAPLITEAYAQQDENAIAVVKQQIQHISEQIETLLTHDLNICLMGGLAGWVTPLLPVTIQQRLTPAQSDALSGALSYAQRGNNS